MLILAMVSFGTLAGCQTGDGGATVTTMERDGGGGGGCQIKAAISHILYLVDLGDQIVTLT